MSRVVLSLILVLLVDGQQRTPVSARDVLAGRIPREGRGAGRSTASRSSLTADQQRNNGREPGGNAQGASVCTNEMLREINQGNLLARAYNLDVTTASGNSVFWSTPNMNAAQMWAFRNGKSTLETTPGGRPLNNLKLFTCKDGSTGAKIWNIASARYAENARGPVYVFDENSTPIGEFGVRAWFKIELPRLLKSGPRLVPDIIRMSNDGRNLGSYFATPEDRARARDIVMRASSLEEGGKRLAAIISRMSPLERRSPIRIGGPSKPHFERFGERHARK